LEKCIIATVGSNHRLVKATKARRVFFYGRDGIVVENEPVELQGPVRIIGFDGLNFLVKAERKKRIFGALCELLGIKRRPFPAAGNYSIDAHDFCNGIARGVKFIDNSLIGEDFT